MKTYYTMKAIVAAIVRCVRGGGVAVATPEPGQTHLTALRGMVRAAKLAGDRLGRPLCVTILPGGDFEVGPEDGHD